MHNILLILSGTIAVLVIASMLLHTKYERMNGVRKICKAFKRLHPYEYERFKYFSKAHPLFNTRESLEQQDYTLFVGICKDYFHSKLNLDCGVTSESIIKAIRRI